MLNKKTFHKKWYYKLLRITFLGSLLLFTIPLVLFGTFGILGIYESDIPAAAFLWAGTIAILYWFIKKLFYYIMFGESVLP
jgi:hypothetical protein